MANTVQQSAEQAESSLRHYEITLMFNPRSSEHVPDMLKRIGELVGKSGKVYRCEDWGRKSLAYSINNVAKAHYALLNIACEEFCKQLLY